MYLSLDCVSIHDMYLDMFVCTCLWTAYLFLFFHLSI
jgi:hypothetical protein